MAPAYHWLLGPFLYLFGPYHSVTRPVSVVVSLAGLYLFFLLARVLSASRLVAFWSVMLLGTSYGAVMVDRRAYIEPFQITLMIALCLCAQGSYRKPGREAATAALTALLLLTKASAIFLIPALCLAAGWPVWWREAWPRLVRMTVVVAAGVAVTVAIFSLLEHRYPAEFAEGWGSDLAVSNLAKSSPLVKVGRFGIDPRAVEASIAWLGLYEPATLGLGAAGVLMALWRGEQILMALWLVFGAVFLSIQFYVKDNHRAVIVAPLCFLAAWVLVEVDRSLTGKDRTRAVTWPIALLALVVAFNSLRLTAALAGVRQAEAGVVAWTATHTGPSDTVIAAPYILMRLPARPVNFFRIKPPFLPTAEAVRRFGATWLVMDEREWMEHIAISHATRADAGKALAECCELAWQDPAARPGTIYRVYRVKAAAVGPASPSPSAGR